MAPKKRPAAWVSPLSRFRDLLPPRHGRPARQRASGIMASEWLEHAGRYGAPQGDDGASEANARCLYALTLPHGNFESVCRWGDIKSRRESEANCSQQQGV